MTRRILINGREEDEIRVAVLEDDLLDDLFVERANSRKHLGNIYRGRVTNLEPAIQAAFIDFGGDRNGFLHASDVMPFCADLPEDLTAFVKRPQGGHPQIQDLLQQGQEVLVQVSKDGIGHKGATLTTYVSLPGKYIVLMPSLARVGVSKKIRDVEVRERLKRTIRELNAPEGMGFIVRTAGAKAGLQELRGDLEFLTHLWESLARRVANTRAPARVYLESDLVIRTIRDIFTAEVEELVVDSPEVYRKAEEFIEGVMPEYRDRLRLFTGERPLFHAFGVEAQIEKVFQRRVALPSGGYLLIEPTEALVAVDVNSGRFRRELDLEDTAYHLNLEAIPEICRQLRLRDLGGLIIVDMVDMRDLERRRDVERTFLRELRKDKARVRVAPISEFGVLELTRQRVKPSLRQETYERCRTCRGSGFVKSVDSMLLKVLREIRAFIRQDPSVIVLVTVHQTVAEALLNRKRSALLDLEGRFGREILVRGDAHIHPEELLIQPAGAQ